MTSLVFQLLLECDYVNEKLFLLRKLENFPQIQLRTPYCTAIKTFIGKALTKNLLTVCQIEKSARV